MSKARYENIAAAVYGSVWAIMPEKLQAIVDVVKAKIEGQSLDWPVEEAAIQTAAARAEGKRVNAVAVLPLVGTISQRMNMMTAFSGGTSSEIFGRDFDQALADDSVNAIVIDADSPGGAVAGTPELASKIFQARGRKPIISVVNSLMASACYWIGSAADEVVVTPSGQLGSIGVVAVHTETSKADRKIGVKSTLIYSGKYKTEGNPYEPLGDEARATIQTRLDHYYRMFINAIAEHRGLSSEMVEEKFGQGRIFLALAAIERGMADRTGTLESVLAELLAGTWESHRSTAQAVQHTTQEKSTNKGKEPDMDTETKPALTVESLKADHPDIHAAVFSAGQAEGVKLEKERFAALLKACGEDFALLAECFAANMTVADTLAKANEKLVADLKAEREKNKAQPAGGTNRLAAATAEFKIQPAPRTEAEEAAQFDEATATDQELEAHFAATAELRDQFSSAKAYVAHVRHPPRT